MKIKEIVPEGIIFDNGNTLFTERDFPHPALVWYDWESFKNIPGIYDADFDENIERLVADDEEAMHATNPSCQLTVLCDKNWNEYKIPLMLHSSIFLLNEYCQGPNLEYCGEYVSHLWIQPWTIEKTERISPAAKMIKISKIYDKGILFDDGSIIFTEHDRNQEDHDSCSEYHWADFSMLENYNVNAKTGESINIYDLDFCPDAYAMIQFVPDMGFNLTAADGSRYFVPCYGDNNGYYTTNLSLYLRFPYQENITWIADLTKCQEIHDGSTEYRAMYEDCDENENFEDAEEEDFCSNAIFRYIERKIPAPWESE